MNPLQLLSRPLKGRRYSLTAFAVWEAPRYEAGRGFRPESRHRIEVSGRLAWSSRVGEQVMDGNNGQSRHGTVSVARVTAVESYLSGLSREKVPEASQARAWDDFYRTCTVFISRLAARFNVPSRDTNDFRQDVWAALVESFQAGRRLRSAKPIQHVAL